MRRGSTYRNTFKVSLDLRDATVFITYSQDEVIVEKTGDDLFISEDEIVTNLSQEETLLFNDGLRVDIQIRYIMPDGTSDSSNIMTTTVGRILKDGVITYGPD